MKFIVPGWEAPSNVHALFSLRDGGVSGGPYAHLNLGDHVGDDPAAVAENRRRLGGRLPAEPAWLRQVHGTRCIEAGTAEPGIEADACFTRGSGVVCAVLVADCLPVLLCADDGSVVAAAHAGWRGLAAGVIEATVAALGIPGERLLAWLGPAIGPQAFEVGDEVRAAFVAVDPAAGAAFRAGVRPGTWWCDLGALARLRLAALGVRRVASADLCTWSDAARFFSHRRDGISGRMAACIWRE